MPNTTTLGSSAGIGGISKSFRKMHSNPDKRSLALRRIFRSLVYVCIAVQRLRPRLTPTEAAFVKQLYDHSERVCTIQQLVLLMQRAGVATNEEVCREALDLIHYRDGHFLSLPQFQHAFEHIKRYQLRRSKRDDAARDAFLALGGDPDANRMGPENMAAAIEQFGLQLDVEGLITPPPMVVAAPPLISPTAAAASSELTSPKLAQTLPPPPPPAITFDVFSQILDSNNKTTTLASTEQASRNAADLKLEQTKQRRKQLLRQVLNSRRSTVHELCPTEQQEDPEWWKTPSNDDDGDWCSDFTSRVWALSPDAGGAQSPVMGMMNRSAAFVVDANDSAGYVAQLQSSALLRRMASKLGSTLTGTVSDGFGFDLLSRQGSEESMASAAFMRQSVGRRSSVTGRPMTADGSTTSMVMGRTRSNSDANLHDTTRSLSDQSGGGGATPQRRTSLSATPTSDGIQPAGGNAEPTPRQQRHTLVPSPSLLNLMPAAPAGSSQSTSQDDDTPATTYTTDLQPNSAVQSSPTLVVQPALVPERTDAARVCSMSASTRNAPHPLPLLSRPPSAHAPHSPTRATSVEQTWESFLDRSQNDLQRRQATREASILEDRLARESAPPVFEVPVVLPGSCINALPAPSELWRAEWEQLRKRRLQERDELCRPNSAALSESPGGRRAAHDQRRPFDARPASAASRMVGLRGVQEMRGPQKKKSNKTVGGNVVCETRSCSAMEAARPLMAAELMPRWLTGGVEISHRKH